MKRGIVGLVLVAGCVSAVLAATESSGAGSNRTASYSARVGAPPRVQYAGETYTVRIYLRNLGSTVKPFCIDFGDDNNSWLIDMPGLSKWNSDGFCLGTLRGYTRKTLRAYVTAARAGGHEMSITLGKAKVYRDLRRIIIDDKNALRWEDQFVILS